MGVLFYIFVHCDQPRKTSNGRLVYNENVHRQVETRGGTNLDYTSSLPARLFV
jgi:hypothetical protein